MRSSRCGAVRQSAAFGGVAKQGFTGLRQTRTGIGFAQQRATAERKAGHGPRYESRILDGDP